MEKTKNKKSPSMIIVSIYIADFFVSDNIQGDRKVSPQ